MGEELLTEGREPGTAQPGTAQPGTAQEPVAAFQIHEFGGPPKEALVLLPEVGSADVLVKMTATVVSHHDLMLAAGVFPPQPSLPYVPGLEGAGHVVQAGADIDAGDFPPECVVRVYGGGLGATRPGTWSEYVVVPARSVTRVPEGLDPLLAAACGSVAATAWAAVFQVGGLQAGERLGVTGATGAVGSLALQLGAENGARSRVGWVRTAARSSRVPAGVEVLEAGDAPTEPVDLLVDTVGGPLFESHLEAVRPGGRAVLVGYTAGERVCILLPDLLVHDVTLQPLNMMRRRVPKEVEASLLAGFAEGRLQVAIERFDRGGMFAAIERLRAGEASGRLVLEW